jgi:hypothetical protein
MAELPFRHALHEVYPDQAADRKRRRRPSPARPRAWVRLTQALVKISYNRKQGDISLLHSWQ